VETCVFTADERVVPRPVIRVATCTLQEVELRQASVAMLLLFLVGATTAAVAALLWAQRMRPTQVQTVVTSLCPPGLLRSGQAALWSLPPVTRHRRQVALVM
jgi:hypothetical protein